MSCYDALFRRTNPAKLLGSLTVLNDSLRRSGERQSTRDKMVVLLDDDGEKILQQDGSGGLTWNSLPAVWAELDQALDAPW